MSIPPHRHTHRTGRIRQLQHHGIQILVPMMAGTSSDDASSIRILLSVCLGNASDGDGPSLDWLRLVAYQPVWSGVIFGPVCDS